MFIVRTYCPETDAAMVAGWWAVHRSEPMPLALLPPVGVVVMLDKQPVCALWLFLTIGHGVAFAEYPVSAPGLGAGVAREAFDRALEALEAVALAHNYKVMVCHTLPAIARILKQHGYRFGTESKITGTKVL